MYKPRRLMGSLEPKEELPNKFQELKNSLKRRKLTEGAPEDELGELNWVVGHDPSIPI